MASAGTTSRDAGRGAAPTAAASARTRPRGRGGVTLTDVAAAAGVSVPTVSKVLNGHADVSPATRAKVQDTMRLAINPQRLHFFDARTEAAI